MTLLFLEVDDTFEKNEEKQIQGVKAKRRVYFFVSLTALVFHFSFVPNTSIFLNY